MKEIGDYLRRVREEKNISLKDIQEATKISMRYLEAIDRGDFNGIPGEVYRKGFLVNFANTIGLNGQEILQRYNQIKASQEEEVRVAQCQATLQEKNTRGLDNEQMKGIYLGVVVALIGILIILSFVGFSSFRQGELKETSVSETATSEAKTENFPAPITVSAVFKESIWIVIKADGEYPLGAGGVNFDSSQPKQIWTAQREMIITMGNPAGLILTFNGKELGQLGERGVKKTVKLTPQGLEAL